MRQPKKIQQSQVAMELKKEYLREHLEEVKRLIEKWVRQLTDVHGLFTGVHSHTPIRGQRFHLPSAENDSDKKAQLKGHLKGRALWRHHADWERRLGILQGLADQVILLAEERHHQNTKGTERQYTLDYVGTALWQAFEIARGGGDRRGDYGAVKGAKNRKGVIFTELVIEGSVVGRENRLSVEKQHLEFSYEMAMAKEMKEIVGLWGQIAASQRSMRALATKALKSNDILYPCRFCKHLWI